MEIVKLKSQVRQGSGTGYCRKARVRGFIPAIYYGHGEKSKNIEVDAADYARLVRAKQTAFLIDLSLEGEKDSIAVIKEVQKHIIKDRYYIHLDFQHVNMQEKLTMSVPLEIVGLPVGVKDEGGILGHSIKEITVECLPLNIPEKILVDVSGLHIGESIHIKDLTPPENVFFKGSPDEVLAVVTRPAKDDEKKSAPAEADAKPDDKKKADASKKTGDTAKKAEAPKKADGAKK